MDEVHLLNDERGAVIETLVARTQRQASSLCTPHGQSLPALSWTGSLESSGRCQQLRLRPCIGPDRCFRVDSMQLQGLRRAELRQVALHRWRPARA